MVTTGSMPHARRVGSKAPVVRLWPAHDEAGQQRLKPSAQDSAAT